MSFRFVKPGVCAQELPVLLAGFAPVFPSIQPGGSGAHHAGQIHWVAAATRIASTLNTTSGYTSKATLQVPLLTKLLGVCATSCDFTRNRWCGPTAEVAGSSPVARLIHANLRTAVRATYALHRAACWRGRRDLFPRGNSDLGNAQGLSKSAGP